MYKHLNTIDFSFNKKILQLLIITVILLLPIGCKRTLSIALTEVMKSLGDANCKYNEKIKVGGNLQVMLFVKHYIYVDDCEYVANDQPGKKWRDCVTKNFYGSAIKNTEYISDRANWIKKCMSSVNNILSKNNTNITLAGIAYDVILDSKMVVANNSRITGSVGYTRQVVDQTKLNDPGVIHVHWCLSNNPTYGNVIGTGVNYSIVVSDDVISGSKLYPLDFSHEMIHALGYETHSSIPLNIMNENNMGGHMSKEQIDLIWQKLNSGENKLNSISCPID